MNVATLLVDPDGKGVDGHWEQTARSLLIGAITHVVYRARNEDRTGNLSEVLHELTGNGYEDMANSWKQYEHKRDGDVFYDPTGNVRESPCHPVVEQVANEMLNRAEEEASSVLSTAVAKLGLYTDPVVARNTSVSDFRIQDVMDNESPVSLYLVLNPTNIQRLKPLVRLFISQLVFILMPEMEFSGGQMKAPYKHRLLLLLDEFPALGKLGIFEQAIAYFGGWNIKAYLICQDKAQLDAAYGKDESITSNCHVTVAYAPNKVETAKYADKDAEYASDWAENWYVKQVHFLENQTTTTRVTYTCKYGVTSTGLYFGIDGSLDYIYGTGRTWKSSIGKITFDVRNLSGIVYVMGYRFLNKKYGSYSIDASGFNQVADNKVSFKWISPDTFRIEAENVEPESAAELLEIYLHRFSYQNVEDFMKRYPEKNPINARCDFTRAFLKYDLRFMTENQLRLARNDFYALYGRGFQSKEIRDFYESISGYKVSKDYSDDLLSEEEKQIINRIIEIENGRKKTQ